MTVTAIQKAGDLLRVADLDPARLELVLDLAALMKAEPSRCVSELRSETLACLFEKPSTRTRVSFAAAAHRLGMLPLVLRPDELQLGRGELLADTARALSGYAAAIVVRTFAQRTLEELAESASVPVINALSDDHHPCQALADLLTIRERFGRLASVRLAFVGAGSNVAHSLLEAGALAGMEIAVASPLGHAPRREVAADALAAARRSGGSIEIQRDPREAVHCADVVYTDVWASMGEEDKPETRRPALEPYRVTEELLGLAKPDAIFLHCLPAHRGEEVDAEVIDGPQSAVWQQAANRLPTEEALLFALIRGWDAAEGELR